MSSSVLVVCALLALAVSVNCLIPVLLFRFPKCESLRGSENREIFDYDGNNCFKTTCAPWRNQKKNKIDGSDFTEGCGPLPQECWIRKTNGADAEIVCPVHFSFDGNPVDITQIGK